MLCSTAPKLKVNLVFSSIKKIYVLAFLVALQQFKLI